LIHTHHPTVRINVIGIEIAHRYQNCEFMVRKMCPSSLVVELKNCVPKMVPTVEMGRNIIAKMDSVFML
jgi:hypothetical protein